MTLTSSGMKRKSRSGSSFKGKVENAKSEKIQQQLRTKYKRKDKEVKKRLKSDKREWFNSLIDDAQHAPDVGNMKTLYGITKTVCHEATHKNTVIYDKVLRPSQTTPAGLLDGDNISKKSSTDYNRRIR